MKKIKIFDDILEVKDYICTSDKNISITCNPSLRLYVKLTDYCIADCPFCANKNSRNFGNLDINKLVYVINYLYENNYLHSVSFTGGEPLLEIDKLFKMLDEIYAINDKILVQISTSGYNLKELANYNRINNLESIHISHHHYDEEKNKEIFNSKKVATGEDIIYLQDKLDDKKIININTLVMKGYIDSLEEIKKNLNYVGNLDIYKNGFVSLMKCNAYSKEKFINYNDIFNNLDNNFFKGHKFYSKKYCECVDGIYLTDNNKLVEYYARMIKETTCPYITQLVYTSDNRLLDGFNGNEISIVKKKIKK